MAAKCLSKKQRVCVVCGDLVERKFEAWFRVPPERTTCGVGCRNKLVSRTRDPNTRLWREKNPAWAGGMMHSRGYVYLLRPDHPKVMKNGYVKRATVVLEEKIGRPLKKNEFAHHQDENKENDSPDNLILKTRSQHQRLHAQGNQHWRKRRKSKT